MSTKKLRINFPIYFKSFIHILKQLHPYSAAPPPRVSYSVWMGGGGGKGGGRGWGGCLPLLSWTFHWTFNYHSSGYRPCISLAGWLPPPPPDPGWENRVPTKGREDPCTPLLPFGIRKGPADSCYNCSHPPGMENRDPYVVHMDSCIASGIRQWPRIPASPPGSDSGRGFLHRLRDPTVAEDSCIVSGILHWPRIPTRE